MDDWKAAFGEEWDAVVLGTGMKECLLSGLLSVAGKKVLHLDRNDYYGGASASLDINQLFEKFQAGAPPSEAELGKLRDWAVDMVPKFIMAGGQLVKVLIHTKTANYMEFKAVDGSYCYRAPKARSSGEFGRVHKVPLTPKEALSSSMLSMLEKGRMGKFTMWVASIDCGKPEGFFEDGSFRDMPYWTRVGMTGRKKMPLTQWNGDQFFKDWGLEAGTIEFLTHVCALYRDESWRSAPALEVVSRMQLYLESRTRFAGMTSPYLYPLFGLGELPQAFARLAAVHGGTYMLNRDLDGSPVFGPNDLSLEYAEDGTVAGVVNHDGEEAVVARTKTVVGDPSYFAGKTKPTGSVVRAIALLDAPLAEMEKDGASSCQVIFPAAQCGRCNDLYLFLCSNAHKVAPAGKYVAFLSTKVEGRTQGMSNEQIAHRELAAGLALFTRPGAPMPLHLFYDAYPTYAPLTNGTKDRVFISESFDATSHFETAINDVLDMYQRITGETLNLDALAAAASAEQ